ncbi:response regulator [Fundidesulfovibrio butyratiphilus]
MADRILFVDDEAHVLDAFKASLGRRYDVRVAGGPNEALLKLRTEGPFKVVVSDYKMASMDGVALLSKIRELSPKTIRIILTGHADIDMAVDAVNKGSVFRFLTKPCPQDLLIGALESALEQYRLTTLESELLRSTLFASVKVLTEILSLVNPEAFGRSERVRRVVVGMVKELCLKNALKYELAAMLSQIGCVSVPSEILAKKYCGQKLDPEEQQIFEMSVHVAVSLIARIPRLEEVSRIVACQSIAGCERPEESLGGTLLRLALDYDDCLQTGMGANDALEELRRSSVRYGEDKLMALERFLKREEGYQLREVTLDELTPGMVLAQDVRSYQGGLMLAKGLELSRYILERLAILTKTRRIIEPITVFTPDEKA